MCIRDRSGYLHVVRRNGFSFQTVGCARRQTRIVQCPESPIHSCHWVSSSWLYTLSTCERAGSNPRLVDYTTGLTNGVASKSHMAVDCICRIRRLGDCGLLGPPQSVINANANEWIKKHSKEFWCEEHSDTIRKISITFFAHLGSNETEKTVIKQLLFCLLYTSRCV